MSSSLPLESTRTPGQTRQDAPGAGLRHHVQRAAQVVDQDEGPVPRVDQIGRAHV